MRGRFPPARWCRPIAGRLNGRGTARRSAAGVSGAVESKWKRHSVESECIVRCAELGGRLRRVFRIEDRLFGMKTILPVALRFLVHPDLAVQAEGDTLSIGDGVRRLVSIEGPQEMNGLIVRGQGDNVGAGWYSPSFGKRVATACIVFEGTMKEGDIAVTQLRIGG